MYKRRINELSISVVPHGSVFNCSHCNVTTAKFTCMGCTAVKYCSKDCQKQHRPTHKDICKTIAKFRSDLKKESTKLKAHIEDLTFEDEYYTFEDYAETLHAKPYFQKRLCLARVLLNCGRSNNSRLAFELAVEHAMDLFWLARYEEEDLPMNDVAVVGDLLLLVERYQDFYDMVKWIRAVCYGFDPGETFMDMKDEDMCESLDHLAFSKFDRSEFYGLFRILYMKINVKNNLISENERFDTFLVGTDPRATCDSPAVKLRGHPIVVQLIRFYAVPTDNILTKIENLEDQERDIFSELDNYNQFFFPGLLSKKIVDYDPRKGAAGSVIYHCDDSINAANILVKQFREAYDIEQCHVYKDVLSRIRELCVERYGEPEIERRISMFCKTLLKRASKQTLKSNCHREGCFSGSGYGALEACTTRRTE